MDKKKCNWMEISCDTNTYTNTKLYTIGFGRNRKIEKEYVFDEDVFEHFAESIVDFISNKNE